MLLVSTKKDVLFMSISLSRSQFNELSAEGKKLAILEGEREIAGPSIPLSKSNVQTKDLVDSLVVDCVIEIFSYLNVAELRGCCLVGKDWNNFVKENHSLWKAIIYREIAFGKEKWAKYFGDVGKAPPLPEDIYEILRSPCPTSDGKKVGETHMLVLIPEKVNETPLTLNSLDILVKAPKNGHKAFLFETDIHFRTKIIDLREKPIEKSCWVLMTKDILVGSRDKTYGDQVAMIKTLAEKAKTNYQVPKALETAVCIFTKIVETGKYFSSCEKTKSYYNCSYTSCQEEDCSEFHFRVGSFSPYLGRLCISKDGDWVKSIFCGIAAQRKL